MVYMGSKAKYAQYIVPILQNIIDSNNIDTYIEPFVGGANIIDKIKCVSKYGFDKNQTLIALHQRGQSNPLSIPEHGSPEWWYKAKDEYRATEGKFTEDNHTMSLWEIGAIAFFASFSNGGFSRGYAKNSYNRDYYNEAYRNFMAQISADEYKNIKFEYVNDYTDIVINKNALFYCDPPYQGTKPYGYKFETGFNYDKYWNWIREISATNFVVCSEQSFPDDFDIIWEQSVKRTCGKDNNYKATEKLGVYSKGLLGRAVET